MCVCAARCVCCLLCVLLAVCAVWCCVPVVYRQYSYSGKKGSAVSNEDIVEAAAFVSTIHQHRICTYNDTKIPSGVLVEELYPPHMIVKVWVSAGKIHFIYTASPSLLDTEMNERFKYVIKYQLDDIRRMCRIIADVVPTPILRLDFMVPVNISLDISINEIEVQPQITLGTFLLMTLRSWHLDKCVQFINDIMQGG